ncbi:hypothetical protein QWI17_20485 [Gilvimarinus sp. SDUM040013]|uniref:ABC transporter permease n=1 Tax=Gilvimarinus gilvus TaxID=3058038 RepID=A0ABU4RSC2_9GAMM|nr:hypothetical protein [Gilvimarinus sp. SDUM040013]MDO3388236.1 hypothetical protein [Gilvimarinus sp. SDUM040013]MDX6847786.1 hypothetical protein [Gilvimarinus sp. SDUM040013]
MSIEWLLIKRDIAKLKLQMLCYGGITLFGLILLGYPQEQIALLGGIVCVFSMVAFYCHLVFKNVVLEAKENNHLFLMTLPVTAAQLSLVKIISSLLAYLIVWLPAFASLFVLNVICDYWSSGTLVFQVQGFALYLTAFALALSVAIVSRSEGWTISAWVLSNLIVVVFLNIVPSSDYMQKAFSAGIVGEIGVVWPETANVVIAVELILFAILIAIAFVAAVRQKNITR